MLEPPKKALHGQRFGSDDKIKDVAHKWLQSYPKTFFAVGTRRFVKQG